MTEHACTMPEHGKPDAPHPCCLRPPRGTTIPPQVGTRPHFWSDRTLWRRAALNTGHCLLGCAIGDIAAMTMVPVLWPTVPMAALMAIAMASGLLTSIALETAILRLRESLTWWQALTTSLGMSLLSMLLMEAVMNGVDWLFMGGQRLHWHDPLYWLAWGPALLAGFLAPLPYNYYVLKRHGRSCH